MRHLVALVAFAALAGCGDNTETNNADNVEHLPQQVPAQKPLAKPIVKKKPIVGTVVNIKTSENGRSKRDYDLNSRLHFCVFENGDSDYIYVGTNYGKWADGEFDLSVDDKIIFTGNSGKLIYNGVVIQMGDVLDKQPESNIGINVTRVTGWFK